MVLIDCKFVTDVPILLQTAQLARPLPQGAPADQIALSATAAYLIRNENATRGTVCDLAHEVADIAQESTYVRSI